MKNEGKTTCQPLDIPGMPPESCKMLVTLVEQSREYLCDDLVSIVLYGSAVMGNLRAMSDINLLFVLRQFTRKGIDPLRETLRLARTAFDMKVMFALETELNDAADAFALKFADIAHRHLILYGSDVVTTLFISRAAKIAQLKQVLLNLIMRLRERYAVISLREEQMALVLADFTGPMRVAAALLLELEGTPAASSKEALELVTTKLAVLNGEQTLHALSQARETRILPSGIAAETCFTLVEIAEGMRRHAEEM
ncbi:MAG: hypothetical protein ACYC0V_12660 [Armatimonadota bacterium]